MRKLSKIPAGSGMILFSVGGSGLDSDGAYGIIMAVLALAGLALIYAGWRCGREKEAKRDTSVKHRNSNSDCVYLDIYHPGSYPGKLK